MSSNSYSAGSLPSDGFGADRGEDLKRVINWLGQAQSNLKHYIDFLTRLLETESSDLGTQREQIREIVKNDGEFVKKQLEQIVTNMRQVEDVASSPYVADYSVEIAKVQDSLERLVPRFSERKKKDSREQPVPDYFSYEELVPDDESLVPALPGKNTQLSDLDEIRKLARVHLDRARKIRREIGIFTIPLRIKRYIEELAGVGSPLDFHERFKEELDEAEDRVAVLRRLSELNTNRIGGMVDIEKGMIYRIGGPRRRWGSYLVIVGTAGIGLLIIFLLSSGILVVPGINLSYKFEKLVLPYMLTFAGVIVHIFKQAGALSLSERSKGSEGGAQVILDQLWLWIHVREFRFIGTVATAFGAFLLLALTKQIDNATVFLAGYSVDSFSDLVFQRFNTAVSEQSKEVKKALSAIK